MRASFAGRWEHARAVASLSTTGATGRARSNQQVEANRRPTSALLPPSPFPTVTSGQADLSATVAHPGRWAIPGHAVSGDNFRLSRV
jgi:hypothetical protein